MARIEISHTSRQGWPSSSTPSEAGSEADSEAGSWCISDVARKPIEKTFRCALQ